MSVDTPTFLQPLRYVGIKKFCELVGVYSPCAVRKKIDRGVWREGQVIKHAPDGHVLIDIQGYYKWVEEGAVAGLKPSQNLSGLSSTSVENHFGRL